MEVGAYHAKTHLADLLERVARGERITITKRGKAIAELRPVASADRAPLSEALARVDATRARMRKQRIAISKDDILAAIREGRR